MDEVDRIDVFEERLTFKKSLVHDTNQRRMPDAAVGSSIGHKLIRPVAIVGDSVWINGWPRYYIVKRCILIEPILFSCQYLLFVHVDAHIAPLVVADEKSKLDETGVEVRSFA